MSELRKSTGRSDFWARRKAAVQAEAEAEIAEQAARDDAAREADLAERSDEDLLAEAGLPAPEDIETPEQAQDFLKSALPQRLKTRALRRLWRLNPVLANLDGLVDYGEDYTDAATVVENLQTVYQVGKGMFDKAEEAARAAEEKRLKAEAAAAQAEDDDIAQTKTSDEAPSDDTSEMATTEDAQPAPELVAEAEPEIAAPAIGSRRMRFHFDTPSNSGQT